MAFSFTQQPLPGWLGAPGVEPGAPALRLM
jgi:hypothetical protein